MASSRLLRLSPLPTSFNYFTPRQHLFRHNPAAQTPIKNRREFRCASKVGSSTPAKFLEKASDPTVSDEELRLVNKLTESFPGGQVTVQDVSGGCGQFYAIQVIHSDFSGIPIIKQHRLVNKALADDIKAIHGLQVDH